MSDPKSNGLSVVRGGAIWTGARHVDALAVRDGLVIAVGDEATELDGPNVASIDVGDAAIIPAFRDGHAHPLVGGRERASLDLSGLTSVEAILTKVRQYAAANPDDVWIRGGGYEPVNFPDGIADASILDAACADRPAILISNDHHMAWVNTKALAIAGINRETPDPPLGSIPRSGDNTPRGTLLEWGAMALVEKHLPKLSREQELIGLRTGMSELSKAGIVWAQDAAVTSSDADVYLDAARQGLLTSRINLAWRLEPERWMAQQTNIVDRTFNLKNDPEISAVLTAKTVKFFADGVIEGGTGFLLEPYEGDPETHNCGLPNWAPEALAEAVRHYDNLGFQIHIHAIGDGGVRMALDAIEHAIRLNGPKDRRPVIAHTQLVALADRPRFAKLGVIANFEPLWACLDDAMEKLTLDRLGPQRSALQYPIGSLANTGARVSFGSDWPVSSVNPLHGLAVAVTRQNEHGHPGGGWLPEERLPLEAALKAYTTGSAYQAFEDNAGQLEVGQPADFCALEADITAMAGNEVSEVGILGTWLGGKLVYERA